MSLEPEQCFLFDKCLQCLPSLPPSQDKVEVEVVQLTAVRIRAPITRMKVGTQVSGLGWAAVTFTCWTCRLCPFLSHHLVTALQLWRNHFPHKRPHLLMSEFEVSFSLLWAGACFSCCHYLGWLLSLFPDASLCHGHHQHSDSFLLWQCCARVNLPLVCHQEGHSGCQDKAQ